MFGQLTNVRPDANKNRICWHTRIVARCRPCSIDRARFRGCTGTRGSKHLHFPAVKSLTSSVYDSSWQDSAPMLGTTFRRLAPSINAKRDGRGGGGWYTLIPRYTYLHFLCHPSKPELRALIEFIFWVMIEGSVHVLQGPTDQIKGPNDQTAAHWCSGAHFQQKCWQQCKYTVCLHILNTMYFKRFAAKWEKTSRSEATSYQMYCSSFQQEPQHQTHTVSSLHRYILMKLDLPRP